MTSFKEPLFVVLAYLIGCFSSAYYLTRWTQGKDIRDLESGNAGALNAGRVLGAKGFIAVFVLDFLKGAAAIFLAKFFNLTPIWLYLTMFAVVLGHLYPVQLGFKGGKGLSTYLGLCAMYNPMIILPAVIVFVIAYFLTKKFTASGLFALALTPAGLLLMKFELSDIVVFTLLILVILSAYKSNIRHEMSYFRSSK